MPSFSWWSAAVWGGVLVGLGLVVLVAQMMYFLLLCRWADRQTRGSKYYGRPLAERRRFKRTLGLLALGTRPLLWLLGRTTQVQLAQASFRFQGVAGPKDSCSPESFAEAVAYRPTDRDIFVATQMKSGTTWMQHLVYQILTRGRGDLAERGDALYAISPWIEGIRSVKMADASTIGAPTSRRIIKTHLPTSLCPYVSDARYIYVARHPVSCFVSAVDFLGSNLGPFRVPLSAYEQWFCSDQMWWGAWPQHVSGWMAWSRERPNVMFVRFEEMGQDLPAVAQRVAKFIGVDGLTSEELGLVAHHCSFTYMQQHADSFEMNPPTVLQVAARPFVRGTNERHADVSPEVYERILRWCRESAGKRYADLIELYREIG